MNSIALKIIVALIILVALSAGVWAWKNNSAGSPELVGCKKTIQVCATEGGGCRTECADPVGNEKQDAPVKKPTAPQGNL